MFHAAREGFGDLAPPGARLQVLEIVPDGDPSRPQVISQRDREVVIGTSIGNEYARRFIARHGQSPAWP